MSRWSKKTDFLAVRLPLLLLVLYLIFMQLFKKPFYLSCGWTDAQTPYADGDIYIWLQFVVFIFVCTVVSFYFEETFRLPSAHYIGAFGLGTFKTVFMRYVRILIALEAVYLPFVVLSVFRMNANIEANIRNFGIEYALLDTAAILTQCSVAMLFYVTITLFLMAVFRSRVYTMVFLMAYGVLEVTMMPELLGEYALFYGAFRSLPELYSYFPANTVLMLVLTAIMLPASLILHKVRRA
ncbi:MAG: hypothetical protein J6K66_04465 [Clostridia bacterium]|nr:hypothetical protein [Clostridia bacterium]